MPLKHVKEVVTTVDTLCLLIPRCTYLSSLLFIQPYSLLQTFAPVVSDTVWSV